MPQFPSLADALTWTRLVAIIPISILFLAGMTEAAVIVYVIALATDLFDGMAARANGTASARGARLDGIVDMIFTLGTVWWLTFIAPGLYVAYQPFALLVVLTFIIFAIVSYARTRTLATPHLLSGKLSMATFTLLLPFIYWFGIRDWAISVVWVVAVLARIEAIAWVVRSNDMDAKSALHRQHGNRKRSA